MFDVIVVGARCAGSSTAMLLARKGLRVLVVDRAEFPSDTLSTHYIHQPGVARLQRWGLAERVEGSGCPRVERQVFDVGAFALRGCPPPHEGVTWGCAPRRKVLDPILLEAAAQSGAEVRPRVRVEDLAWDGDRVVGVRGPSIEERAHLVVGADGVYSTVARKVEAPSYLERPPASCAWYSYWSGVPVHTAELYPRPERMIIAAPTNDGLTLVIAYWPQRDFERVRSNLESEFRRALDLVPGLSQRLLAGTREEPFRGRGDLRAFFRRPFGPGWALVGDAGLHKNPITAGGISDAFRDAELLAEAVEEGLGGRAPLQATLHHYEQRRNEASQPLYGMTDDLARLESPSPEMVGLFEALRHDEEQTGRFLGTIAGTVPIAEFFSPQNLARLHGRPAAV